MSPLTSTAAARPLRVPPLPVATIDAPFQDARAAQLAYSLDHPRIDPLAASSGSVMLRAGACLHVELGVLGTSHQVTVTRPDDAAASRPAENRARGRTLIRETLACLPADAGGPVPDRSRSRSAAGEIELVHEVLRPTDMGGDVDAALSAASAMAVACAAGFPGDPHALTILGCDGDGDALVWRTWHCYPQAGEIVETRTRFTPEAVS